MHQTSSGVYFMLGFEVQTGSVRVLLIRGITMKTFIAYCFGLLGFLLQGGAVIGLPVYVIFFGGSSWWMLAFFPLGFAGMIPLSVMSSMLKSEKGE